MPPKKTSSALGASKPPSLAATDSAKMGAVAPSKPNQLFY